jgi:hypothetical protein
MHEDELEMLEPDGPQPGSRRFRVAKLLAAGAAVAALGIIGATVAWADSASAGTASVSSQVGQSSTDTQNASQADPGDCPFHSRSGTSSAVGRG